MKILYLNPDRGIPVLGDKGASVHVREFVTAAAELGHEVVLACASLGEGNPAPHVPIVHIEFGDGGLEPECAARGIPDAALADRTTRREVARLAFDRSLPARLLAKLEALHFQPDLVYERQALFHESGVKIAQALGVPRLLEVNAPLVEEQKRFRGLNLEALARQIQQRSYRGADAVVAVSSGVAAHVAAVLGSGRNVHVLANGVDLARFGKQAGRASLRTRLGLGNQPVLGFVGSFKPWHGMMFLLEVFRDLLATRPDLHLVAVGDGPELEAVRDRVAEWGIQDKVRLPGRVPHHDIPVWFNAMDVSVAPYLRHEDFYFSPLKIVEAMAAGCPVVAPRIGQIPALVGDRRSGLLYAPGDAAACARAILELVDAPERRRAMADAARLAAAEFSWTGVVERALALAPEELAEATAPA